MYREAFRTLYFEFDRIVAVRLHKVGKTLRDIGLGYANKNGQNYIERIAEAGLLHELLAVAKSMLLNYDNTK